MDLGSRVLQYLLGRIFNFLSDIVEVIPTVISPKTGVECGGNVAPCRLATGEVGLL